MKKVFVASAMLLALGVSWAQDIASQVPGLLVRTAACVGHDANHVGGTLFNKTDDTIYGWYQIKIYDEAASSLLTKAEAFTAYGRQSKKFNIKLGAVSCAKPNRYALRIICSETNESHKLPAAHCNSQEEI
jgi:hypothetical protein